MKKSSGILSHDKYLQKLFEEDAKIANKDSGYRQYLTSLTTLLTTTNEIYEKGGMLGPKDYDNLMNQYIDAVQKGIDYRDSKGSEARKNVVEYINKILSKDLKALRDTDRNKLKHIDEVFEVSRTVKVEVPQSLSHKVGGQMSDRFPVKSNDGKKGFFTSRTDTANDAKWKELIDEIQGLGLNGSQMKKINQLRTDHKLRAKLMYDINYGPSDIKTHCIIVAVGLGLYKNARDAGVILTPGKKSVLEAMKLLINKADKLTAVYNLQDRLGYDPYTRNDNKNAAMYSVAKFLGCDKLIAKAVPMEVINGDQVLKGTFMENAEGSDLGNLKGDDPLWDYKQHQAPYHKELYRDLADLQVLDYICGNVDRHEGNMIYKTEKKDGKVKLTGLIGIDNDASFPERDFWEQEFIFRDNGQTFPKIFKPENFRFVNRKTADLIRNMNRAQLETILRGHNISKTAIDRAWKRTQEVQNVLENMAEKNIRYVEEIKEGEYSKADPDNPFFMIPASQKNPSIFTGFDVRVQRQIDNEKEYAKEEQEKRFHGTGFAVLGVNKAEMANFYNKQYEERASKAAEYKDVTREQALFMDLKKVEKMDSIMKRINRMKSPTEEFKKMRDAMADLSEYANIIKRKVHDKEVLKDAVFDGYKECLDKLTAATQNYINVKGINPRTEAGKERLKGAMSLDNKVADLLKSFETGKKLETGKNMDEPEQKKQVDEYIDEYDEIDANLV